MSMIMRGALRRFTAERRGFTGAEKALLLTVCLALVMLVSGLLRTGSQRAATDAQRVLMTQEGSAGRVGEALGPVQGTGAVAASGPVGGSAALLKFSGDYAVVSAPAGDGQPAASGAPAPMPAAPALTSGLGAEVDKIASQSPTLVANIEALQKAGWTIQYGKAGGGSYTDRGRKLVVIDKNQAGSALSVVQTLAHESGHARYTPDPYVQPTGKTRDEYVDANVQRSLKDEGEATITNLQIRQELIKAGAGDIGVAGAQSAQYKKLFEAWDGKDRDKLRAQIGKVFATGEHPSTDPGKTYYDYYAKTFRDFYDANVGKKP